jgi:hypothetical protein
MSTLKVDAIRHNSATSDAITTAADGTCTANITSNYSNRSVVYNGAMKIAQRGTNFTGVTASGTFPVDRFLFHVGSLGTWTLSQSTDVPTGQGLSHSIKCDVTTANASPSGTAYARIDQRFEGQDLQRFCKGTSNAKNFAVSFWVKSPKTGTHIVQLQDQDNSRNVSKAYTVSSANTWEKKELILPADTTGAFDNDNGGSLFLCFYLAVGTGYQGGTLQTTWGTPVNNTRATGQVNVADSTSNDFYLTGVQMEASSYCSEFEHRSFGDELLRCYRYYYRLKGEDNKTYMIGMSDNDNVNIYGFFHFPVPMRIPPASIEQNGTAGHYKVRRDTTKSCTGVPTYIDSRDFYCRVNFPSSGHGWGTGQMLWCQGGSSSSYIGFPAEL